MTPAKVRPLAELLDNYVHTRHIDFATLDIEGFEYNLLLGFLYGGVFDRQRQLL